MIVRDCTNLVELIEFRECNKPDANSGWLLDYAFTDTTTIAEKLEYRLYSKVSALPLYYSGACLPPAVIKGLPETVTVTQFNFPTIKAETKVTGCDVDEMRIRPDGTISAVGARWQETVNRAKSDMLDGLRATHIAEAVELVKTGGYAIRDKDANLLGTVNFNRDAALANVDLTGTAEDFCKPCANPIKTFETLFRAMGRCGGAVGQLDVIFDSVSLGAFEAHLEREGIKYDQVPAISSKTRDIFTGYNDVQFIGASNGMTFWLSHVQYYNQAGTLVPMLDPGEVMLLSKAAFGGKRVFRTITSDGKEQLPAGATVFLYDDPDLEYDRKCRALSPWLEEHHLMIPSNVNGAMVFQATDPLCAPCVQCEEC
jgi:Phage major capsid protein E